MLGQLKLKLEIILKESAKSGVNVSLYVPQIKLALMEEIGNINLTHTFSTYATQLEKHWARLEKELIHKGVVARTLNRYKNGLSFWSKYTNVTNYNISSIVTDLFSLSNNKFRGAFDFYSSMLSASDLFPSLPILPKYVKARKQYVKRDFVRIKM